MTDEEPELKELLSQAKERGVSFAMISLLRLSRDVKKWYLETLKHHFPEVVQSYRELYGQGAYAEEHYVRSFKSMASRLLNEYGLGGLTMGRLLPSIAPDRLRPGRTVHRMKALSVTLRGNGPLLYVQGSFLNRRPRFPERSLHRMLSSYPFLLKLSSLWLQMPNDILDRLGRQGLQQVALLPQPFFDVQQVKLRGRNVLADFVPRERRGDGPEPSGPRGIRSGERPPAVVLKIIEVDLIAAVLL